MAIFWRYEGTVGPRERKVGAKLHAQLKHRMELGGLTRSGHRKKIDGVQYEVLSHGYTDEIIVDTTGIVDFVPEAEVYLPDPPEFYRPEPAEYSPIPIPPDPDPYVPEEVGLVRLEEDIDDGRRLMCIFIDQVNGIDITQYVFWNDGASVEDQQQCAAIAANAGVEFLTRMINEAPSVKAIYSNCRDADTDNYTGTQEAFDTVVKDNPGYSDIYVLFNIDLFTPLILEKIEDANVRRLYITDPFGYGIDDYIAEDSGGRTLIPDAYLSDVGDYFVLYEGNSSFDIDDDNSKIDFGSVSGNLDIGLQDIVEQAVIFQNRQGNTVIESYIPYLIT